mgnify:CR=1 FL=1
MININIFYNIRKNMPQFLKMLFPKFLKKKIKKKLFPYYYQVTDYEKLPKYNYINNNNIRLQENLIEKFKVDNKQNSITSCPHLINLLLMKYKPDEKFSFLDIGGEYIDFFLVLKKNFKNVEYYVFNLESINKDCEKLKDKYNYMNLNVIQDEKSIFKNNYDFVNFGSCIQYFENYENFLLNITRVANQIFFSGTILYDSHNENHKKHIIVKQLNVYPSINYLYFFNKFYFYKFFYEKNFDLLFECKNLTDNVNFKNFNGIFESVEYKDFSFIKKNPQKFVSEGF